MPPNPDPVKPLAVRSRLHRLRKNVLGTGGRSFSSDIVLGNQLRLAPEELSFDFFRNLFRRAMAEL
jgi:hypothetical protein